MKTQYWWKALGVVSLIVGLMAWPGAVMAADVDADGIDDAVEATGGAGITFGTVLYLPCTGTPTQGAERNACLSPASKDIFIYIVRSASGFLSANLQVGTTITLEDPAFLFKFITEPRVATTSGKVDGLGVGVHVAFVTDEPTSRAVGTLGQSAVRILVNESGTSSILGRTDVGTPSVTGNATVWPASIKNTVDAIIGANQPAVWQKYIQRTFSHELSHAAALFATYNASLGGYHVATGSGVVMDQSVKCNSSKKTCTIFSDYASVDNPCLLSVDTSNNHSPLVCAALP